MVGAVPNAPGWREPGADAPPVRIAGSWIISAYYAVPGKRRVFCSGAPPVRIAGSLCICVASIDLWRISRRE